MRARFILLTTVIALIAAVPTAAAAPPPPVLGPADGVQATRTGTKLTVTFTGDRAKWTPLIGREVSAVCRRDPVVTGLQLDDDPAGAALAGQQKVGADGTLRYTLHNAKPLDSCELMGFDTHGDVVTLAEAAMTATGVVWLDESRRAPALHTLLDRATAKTGGYRPLAALGSGIVALDGPDATPGPDQTGYWTDGTRATVATLSAAGRRLVIEDLGRQMLRTNVLEQSDLYASLYADPEVFFDVLGEFIPAEKNRSPYRGKLPLTRRDGVRASAAGRQVRIRFTGRSAATFHKLAGRKLTVLCAARPAPSLFSPPTGGSDVRRTTARVTRNGGDVLALMLSGPPGDLCVVFDRGTAVATAAVGAVGRRWLQDIAALRFVTVDEQSNFAPSGATDYWPTAVVVAHKKGRVAMSGPDARVPVGRVGVWSDGGRHAAAATTSASGWRLTVVDEGDGMVRTNMFGRLDLWALLLADPTA